MSCYIRPKVTGARVFFTVGLAWRGSTLLVDETAHLREAVRVTRVERPFEVDAFVVLPDHIRAVWTMRHGDRNYGTRWGAIKAWFSASIRRAGFTPPPRLPA
ncbi:MAG: transposase, partial [Pseudomonadota bacterium]